MSELVSFWVDGIPATQGSKTPGKGGYGFHESDKKLPAWRKAVTAAAESVKDAFEGPLDFPMAVQLDVYLPAPKKSKFGKWPAGTPDLDKLQRAVGDGLTTSKLIKDDARICLWKARKHWAEEGMGTGAKVSIRDLRDENYVPAEPPAPSWATGEFTQYHLSAVPFADTARVKVRGSVFLDGIEQLVELEASPELAERISRGLVNDFSIDAETLVGRVLGKEEIERIFGVGEL